MSGRRSRSVERHVVARNPSRTRRSEDNLSLNNQPRHFEIFDRGDSYQLQNWQNSSRRSHSADSRPNMNWHQFNRFMWSTMTRENDNLKREVGRLKAKQNTLKLENQNLLSDIQMLRDAMARYEQTYL